MHLSLLLTKARKAMIKSNHNDMCKSILIVDDYPLNLMVAKMLIKQHGGFDRVETCLEATRALDILRSNAEDVESLPDIILLDLNMPLMDGWQFLNEFETFKNTLKKNIVIFILSSSIAVTDQERAKLSPSVEGYLVKPLTPDMLIDIYYSIARAI